MEKNKIKIEKVTVSGPPFYGESFEPTNVNFVFGKNGAGKSTISRAIRDNNGVSWIYDPGHNTTVQVFNDEYIKKNIEGEMNGVFTISELDVQTEKEIKQTEIVLEQNNQDITNQKKVLEKNDSDFTSLRESSHIGCWSATRSFIKQLKHNPTPGKSKEAFFNAIEKANPIEHSMNEIRLFESAASNNRFDEIKLLEKISIPDLDTTILSTPIVSLGETQFSLFMKELGKDATDWVYKGYKLYQPISKGLCPYCQEKLTSDKKLLLESAFDDSYKKAIEKLRHFKEVEFPEFTKMIESVFISIASSEGYSYIDMDKYNAVSADINDYVEEIKALIAEKENGLSKSLTPSIKHNLQQSNDTLNEIIKEANATIDAQNRLISSRSAQEDYKRVVCEHCAFLCDEILQHYRTENTRLSLIRDKATVAQREAEQKSNLYISKLTKLREKSTSTLPVITKINNLLEASGFNSFSIAPVGKRNYKLVRPDNSDAQFLSEGEKNFICFLYFYYSVYGVLDESLGFDDRVVVIDDPVSSMDSDSVFIIAELVREIVDATINAFKKVKIQQLPNHIKQVFILTHNSFFYNEVAPMYVDGYDHVSYFEIQKEGAKSHIVPNIKVLNLGCVNERKVNFLPDLGNYSSLWEIYNTSDNPRIIMNTMRRILEEYFLHNLGYKPIEFKKQILEFIKEGTVEANDKLLIRALINYVSNDAISSINFSTYTSDITKLKNIFELIFRCFQQEQHYNMMINR